MIRLACLGAIVVWAILRVSAGPRVVLRLSSYYAANISLTTFALLLSSHTLPTPPLISHGVFQFALAGLCAGVTSFVFGLLLTRHRLLLRQILKERWAGIAVAVASALLFVEMTTAAGAVPRLGAALITALVAGLGFIAAACLLAALRENGRLSSAAAALPDGSEHDDDAARALLYLAVIVVCASALTGIL